MFESRYEHNCFTCGNKTKKYINAPYACTLNFYCEKCYQIAYTEGLKRWSIFIRSGENLPTGEIKKIYDKKVNDVENGIL